MVFNELEYIIAQTRDMKQRVDVSNKELKILKEKLRVFMIDSGLKEYNGVEIRRTFSLDLGYLRMEYPNLAKVFVKEETTTKTKDVISKKNELLFKAKYPNAYQDVRVENTAQVRGL